MCREVLHHPLEPLQPVRPVQSAPAGPVSACSRPKPGRVATPSATDSKVAIHDQASVRGRRPDDEKYEGRRISADKFCWLHLGCRPKRRKLPPVRIAGRRHRTLLTDSPASSRNRRPAQGVCDAIALGKRIGMSYAPVPQRIERTRERIAEIDYELLSMQVKEDTETEDPTEQVELIVVQGRRAAR